MYSLEQVYKLILSQEFKWCSIFDSSNNKVGYFSKTKDKDLKPSEIVEHIKDFMSEFPQGTYTLQFKKSPNGGIDEIHKYKISTSQGTAPKKEVDMESLRNTMKEEIRKEFKEEARKEKEQAKLKDLTKEYEDKIKELNTAGGKVNVLLEGFLLKILGAKNAQGTLAGENSQPSGNSGKEFSDQEIKRVNAALKVMLEHMDVDTFCRFAEKIKSTPGVVSTLKSFL